MKMQKKCGKLLKDVEKVTIQFGTRLLKLFRHILDSLERFFRELLRSEPSLGTKFGTCVFYGFSH